MDTVDAITLHLPVTPDGPQTLTHIPSISSTCGIAAAAQSRCPPADRAQINKNQAAISGEPAATGSVVEDLRAETEGVRVSKCFGPGSVGGAVFNFTVAIVGPGILSIPFAFKESGFVLGFCTLFICCCFCYLSLNLLIMALQHLPSPSNPSYLSLSKEFGGSKLVVFTQINVILSLFGSNISRLAAAGGVLVRLYDEFFDCKDIGNPQHFDEFYAYFVVGISAFIIFPLSLFKISSLRFTSLCSVMCSLFLCICLLLKYLTHCNWNASCFWNTADFGAALMENAPSRLVNVSVTGFLSSFPIFVFAFKCHLNVFSVRETLKMSSSEPVAISSDIDSVFVSALSIANLVYLTAGASAFFLLFEDTQSNVLLSDFGEAPEVILAMIMFAVSMVLAVPVFVNILRENLEGMLWGERSLPFVVRVILSMLICALCAGVTAMFSDISTLFGLMGSTTNPVTGYLLPTYFVWHITPTQSKWRKWILLKYASLAMSVTILLISFGSLYVKTSELML